MEMESRWSDEIGDLPGILQDARERAEVTQVDLARKLAVDPSKLSRIEKGEVTPSNEEVISILRTIGTTESREILEFLSSSWRHSPRPPFRNSHRKILMRAEAVSESLSSFQSADNHPEPVMSLIRQYRSDLLRASEYLRRDEHRFAFVGDIGVGKTTAICLLTGLVITRDGESVTPLSKRTVLETGKGRTTLCEVRIKYLPGDAFGLRILPLGEDAVFDLVSDYCDELRQKWGDEKTESPSSNAPEGSDERIELSEEHKRALRNMAGGLRPEAEQALVQQYSDLESLRAELLSRLRLSERMTTELWWDESADPDAFSWLRREFERVNNGRNREAPFPQHIDIIVGRPLSEHPGLEHLRIDFHDTKGLDSAAMRGDIRACIDDRRAITVLCSSFNDAPSKSVRELLEHLAKTGDKSLFSERIALLVLSQNCAAEEMKDELTGSEVQTTADGYALRRAQMESSMKKLGAATLPILFFDASCDDPRPILSQLGSVLRQMREREALRISQIAEVAELLIAKHNEANVQKAFVKLQQKIERFIDRHAVLPNRAIDPSKQPLGAMQSSHASVVRAATRRNGAYHSLDVYHHIREGIAMDAHERTCRIFDGFLELVSEMKNDAEFIAVQGYLLQLESAWNDKRADFLQDLRHAGGALFRSPLYSDEGLWTACADRWGSGGGFRASAVRDVRAWFLSPAGAKVSSRLDSKVSELWGTDVLSFLRSFLNPPVT